MISSIRIKIIASVAAAAVSALTAFADTIPGAFSRPLQWRLGVEASPSAVLGTNSFLRGENPSEKAVRGSFGGSLRADFSFNGDTREGMLYRGLYQGIGVTANTFFANSLMGSPVSVYVYQGAPIVRFNSRVWLGYEWQFGAAIGWKHYDSQNADNNANVSTTATAHMGIGVKVHYALTDRWELSGGVVAHHYSNGNTSWPNAGINTLGASIGVAYTLTPQPASRQASRQLEEDADRGSWFYDIMAFGAWRKRFVIVGNPGEAQLCPGKFAVAGLQFSPMRRINRWVAVGPALDLKWDESAGLEPYWIQGSTGENIKFERPPFGKQISAGLSAHAELTMPIFAVNAGLGYDFINPKGDKAFYQSLTLKAFVTKNIFLNAGYRLGSFQYPQNLMLGIGVRL